MSMDSCQATNRQLAFTVATRCHAGNARDGAEIRLTEAGDSETSAILRLSRPSVWPSLSQL